MNKKAFSFGSFFIGGVAGFITGMLIMLIIFPFLFPAQPAQVNTDLQQALQQSASAQDDEVIMEIGDEKVTEPAAESLPVEQPTVEEEPEVVSQPVEEPAPVVDNTPKTLLSGSFDPDAQDSDRFHRGEGDVEIVSFKGETSVVFKDNVDLTPGPDYQLYLVPQANVETEKGFNQIKSASYNIGSVKTFDGFSSYVVPDTVDLDDVKGVVVWCESFGQFISYADLS